MSNSDYISAYTLRRLKYGSTHKQRQYNYGIRNFAKYLSQHPSSTAVSIDGTQTIASIISNKQDEFELTKQILTTIDTDIGPGSMVVWDDQNWIVYQRVRQPNETYASCYMVRCNNKIAWIDQYGAKHERYCYIVGAEDSKIKSNFRTWNGIITPQANQYLQILIPYDSSVQLGQKFIINKRAWYVVQNDDISAPGISYYSLTEDKVDRMDDDTTTGIANYNQQGKVKISISDITVKIGQSILLSPVLYDEGSVITTELTYQISNSKIATLTTQNGNTYVNGIKAGQTKVTIYITDSPSVKQEVNVSVVQTQSQSSIIFKGDEQIRVSESLTYGIYSIGLEEINIPIISYQLSNNLVTGKINDGILILTGNQNNRTGTVVVTVSTDSNGTFTKSINVHPLW